MTSALSQGSSLLRRGATRAFFLPGVRPQESYRHLSLTLIRIPVRMVEGPQCHRVAHTHRKVLKGHAFKAVSPNKRFTEGAQAIDGKRLTRIEVHGKNLFYFFGEAPSEVVMHIHFGMSGHFRTSPFPGPETTPTTRLRLENERLGIVAHLSAMTVQHGDVAFYDRQSGKIGPDPLREDADVEKVWEKLHGSKKPVGLVLMDQSMVAGIGNIYRAEILFKAGVHPEQPGNTVDRAAFERIWQHSVLLLQRGFKSGSILTVDPEEAEILGPPWTRRYIYNHPTCGRCKGMVEVWDMAARTVYACSKCQPLVTGTELSAARTQALGKASPHKKFKSQCAPEPPTVPTPKQLSVAALKSKLQSLGQPTKGKKVDLIARLADATAKEATEEEAVTKVHASEAAALAAEGAPLEENATIAITEEDAPSRPPKRKRAPGAGKAFAAKLETEDRNGAAVVRSAGQQAVPEELLKPGKPEMDHWGGLSVPMLKMELQKLGLPVKGKKGDLVERLRCAASTSPAAAPPLASSLDVKPGTLALGKVATAEEAEAEKRAAGEGRNVEHVALVVDTADGKAGEEGEGSMVSKRQGRKRRAPATAART